MGGRFYLPQLDGLRFFASLLVFLHHSPVFPGGSRVASSLKEYGWVGVDLFVVLSAIFSSPSCIASTKPLG